MWERHPLIFGRLDALRPGESIVLINDHEPLPLRLELERMHPGRFTWSAIMTASEVWRVSIARVESDVTSDAVRAALARSSAFRELPRAALSRLAAGSHVVRVARNAAVFDQGEVVAYLGVVAEGAVAVSTASEDGRERRLFDAGAGELLNVFAAFDEGATTGRACATLDAGASVVLVPLDAVRHAVREHPEFARALGIACAQRGRQLIEHIARSSESMVARLAATVLRYAAPARGLVPALAPLPSMTLADLAAASGSVREVVSRTLTQMEEAGAIAREKGRVVRVDRERLQGLV
jgi:uncharacterized protein (DUF2249 family)